MKTLVLLDTNFLFLPHQQRIDIFSEIPYIVPEAHELVTLSTVVSELEKLSCLRSEDGVAARIGLELLKRNGVQVIPAEGSADQTIVDYAVENKASIVVCTNDAELRRMLKRNGIALITLRGKKHIIRL